MRTVMLLAALGTLSRIAMADEGDVPRLADDRLSITLFAETPDIVTPIGMTVDAGDRIFVVESHTHHPSADYAGPKGDRIKVFVDADNDGSPDQVSVFAEGIQQAMNLAVAPNGELYVVCAREVLHLVDQDGDGICDGQKRVLQLETQERYAHNSLLGITFDRDGWMYVARGNTGSHAYRIEGPDGSVVEGYGDGGSIIRCRPDGTQIAEIATGFWNPFDLKFDRSGRLLLVDNDPDARGPNRLLQVVDGGDYGYKSVYGGSGNHPFQGWDGRLPGTLPFIAGIGEAPSGLIDCRRSSLPADYEHSVLVTIWNENSIERLDIQSDSSGVMSSGRQPFLTGGNEFRPVAIDCDSRGNIFLTDWVKVDYPNHGHGRIWRITSTAETNMRPQAYYAEPTESAETKLLRSTASTDASQIAKVLQDGNAFQRHVAVMALSDPENADTHQSLLNHELPSVRLGALLARRRHKPNSHDTIRQCLQDEDEQVRRAALMWAGELLDSSLRPALDTALRHGSVSTGLFETYLAAVENLSGSFPEDFRQQLARRSSTLKRALPEGLIVQLARDANLPPDVRALAIGRFGGLDIQSQRQWLLDCLSADDEISLAIVTRVAHVDSGQFADFGDALTALTLDDSRSTAIRSEAIFALRRFHVAEPERFLPLLRSSTPDLAIETARSYRAWVMAGKATLDSDDIARMNLSPEVAERLRGVQTAAADGTLERLSAEELQHALSSGGDSSRGRRVFFSESVGCSKCHTYGGRGGTLGPDLGGLAGSRSRHQIIDSILNPSAEFAPQYQAWFVVTVDGKMHRGLQLDHKAGGNINLTLDDGSTRTFAAEDIEDYAASPTSLMPTGLESTMTTEEFRDLVSFLTSGSGFPSY